MRTFIWSSHFFFVPLQKKLKNKINDMENIIKWQTGTPKEPGKYLISDKHYNVDSDWWTRKEGWDRHYDEDVMGWCKLSDIDGFKYISSNEN